MEEKLLGFTRCASTSCFTQAVAFIVGIPVCSDHQDQLREFHAPKSLIDPELEPLDIAAVKRLQAEQRTRPRITKRVTLSAQQAGAEEDSGCVYYVVFRRNSDRVKIGTTRQARQRFRTLCSQTGDRLRLLVAEPGGTQQEGERHRQFDHLRVPGSEYFRYTRELIDHIAELRQRFPNYRDFTNVGMSYD
ncbi:MULTISPECIES: GIY-YIG nuclease family protein [Streptomyces]|uniref:GIY-YIG nuclease family protein n=1 Tax=Streptomyces TaxID=1883 RepID=UPI0016761D6B|nr:MULTISPECIES: GIY-YIG nuclease family protein [Streptomyces]